MLFRVALLAWPAWLARATTPLSALSDDSTRSSGLSSERFHDGMIDEAALAEAEAGGDEALDLVNGLGLLLADMGKHEEAEVMHRRALEADEAALARHQIISAEDHQRDVAALNAADARLTLAIEAVTKMSGPRGEKGEKGDMGELGHLGWQLNLRARGQGW